MLVTKGLKDADSEPDQQCGGLDCHNKSTTQSRVRAKACKGVQTTTASIVSALKSIFSRHGIPQVLVSDNGPQYASQEFTSFAREYDFTHVTSSPHFPQSNGQAERTVQTMKKLLDDSEDPYMALLCYRATPLPWCSVTQNEELSPQWPDLEDFRCQDKAFKQK